MIFSTLTSMEAFEELRGEWNDLLSRSVTRSIFLTWEWQWEWWNNFGAEGDLVLIAGRDGAGQLCAIVPLFALHGADNRTVLRIVGDNDISDYLDLLVAPEAAEEFARPLLAYLLASEFTWQSLELGCLPQDACARRLVAAASATEAFKADEAVEITSPAVALPSSWETYLQSLPKKTRHELRRKVRKAEREGRLSMEIVREPDSAEEAVHMFLGLMEKSSPDKSGFLSEAMRRFFSGVARSLSERGWLELVILKSGALPIAALYAFDFDNTLHVYNSGFDPAFPALSPGVVNVAYHLRSAIERGRSEYDFMRGDETYKYRFGAVDKPLYRVTVDRLR